MEKFNQSNEFNIENNLIYIKNVLNEKLPKKEMLHLFGQNTFLIGGFLRDLFNYKLLENSDFDLMSRLNPSSIEENLKNANYKKVSSAKPNEFEYSYNEDSTVLFTKINSRDVQVGLIGVYSVEELLKRGDLTMNCCAYDIAKDEVVTPDFAPDAINKTLKFCSPERALKDPYKILSALKQISRNPDIIIPNETKEVLNNAIPNFVEYFTQNIEEQFELRVIFNNINSEEALNFLKGTNLLSFVRPDNIEGISIKESGAYSIIPLSQVSDQLLKEIESISKMSYGRRFDKNKLFNKKVQTVCIKKTKTDEVAAICLMDRLRIYSIASKDSESIVTLVGDLCRHNSTIWTTITATSTYIIKLAESAGLKIERDPLIITKILINNYPEYNGRLIFDENGSFSKEGSDDSYQYLLRT